MLHASSLLLSLMFAAQASAPPVEPSSAPASAEPAQSAKVLRFAVRDVAAAESDHRLARVLTDALVTELRKLNRTSVLSMDEVRAVLAFEADKQLAGCEASSCLAELADALGVDLLVLSSLTTVGDERVLTIKVLDPNEGKAVGEVTKRVAIVDGSECLAAIGPAVADALPHLPLRPGAVRGVDERLALVLNPPPLSPWIPAAGTLVATTLFVGAGAAGAVNLMAVGRADGLASRATLEKPASGAALVAEQQLVESSFWVAIGFGGAGVLAAAGAGVAALFTDWSGARERTSE
jgi:hypothetical protein